jgi:rhomboid protease GluP
MNDKSMRVIEVNAAKARRSIVVFIVSSLLLASLIFFSKNGISEFLFNNAILKWILLSCYIGYVIILSRRLYASFCNKPEVVIGEEFLVVPNYFLGEKNIALKDIYSVEIFPLRRKREFLIIGIRGKSGYFVSEEIFLTKEGFYEFNNLISSLVYDEKNVDDSESTKRIDIPKKITYATFIISILCFVFYFISTSARMDLPENPGFFLQGMGNKYSLRSGEFYRIFTSTFLHVGMLHLLLNIFVLGVIGSFLERVVSTIRFFNIFLLSSIVAYISFTLFSNYENGAGASGGIFGLWGAYLSLKLWHEKYLPGSVNGIPVWRLAVILTANFFAEFFIFGGAGLEVHLGGFLAGFAYMYFAPLGARLEVVGQPVCAEKYIFAFLVTAYMAGLSYFMMAVS